MRFIIVTGMSGAGKSTVLKTLEDEGYFCVDNLPVLLIEKFADLSQDANFSNDKVAIGIDIRSGKALGELSAVLDSFRSNKFNFEVLYLDAEDEILVKRYKETRRSHPLARRGRIEDGIKAERKAIDFLKNIADYTIDTSNLLTRELKKEIGKVVLKGKDYTNMIVTIMSFGYKFGIPDDADFVFDVRSMPNPYYVAALKKQTGNDQPVRDYVMASDDSVLYVNKLEELIRFLVPEFIKNEGEHQLVVAIGCTGGRHRSVTVANELFEKLQQLPYSVRVFHRDVANDTYVKGEN